MRLKNLFSMGWAVAQAKTFQGRIPLNVMLSVTNRCVSRCLYCNIPARDQKELTTREIFTLIDQMSDMGTQRLGLWGGEPLLRNDIGQIIDYAKNKGFFVTLDSNGHLLEENLPALKNLDHFILALDASEEAHDLQRGQGSFKKAMRAATLLRGKIPTWTITVLTKYNLEEVDFILETAQRLGFLATFQVLHHNDILGKNSGSLLPTRESYREVIRKLIDKKKDGAPIASSLDYLERLSNWPDYSKPVLSSSIDGLRCQAGRFFCNVDTNGCVYPCSLLVGKTRALNYLDVGFKEAFDSMLPVSCRACNASCYTEYNYLYSLKARTIFEWIKAMRRSEQKQTCQ